MTKHPHLLNLTPSMVESKGPQRLFRSRLKGYCRAEQLCRVWVLKTFEEARKRGEFFVVHRDARTGIKHDGINVFAHFFTMFYVSIHEPGLSVLFDRDGALKSTSVYFVKLRDYIWAHRRVLARRCHDMAKQANEIKTHAVPAWNPLKDWLFADHTQSEARTNKIMTFKKTDVGFHRLVARCLWRLANAKHHPWGVSAVQPHAYSNVPVTKKVRTVRIGIRLKSCFFFSVLLFYVHM